MPDHGEDPTVWPEGAERTSHETPVAGDHPARDPLVRCPSCGADVVPREGSYGVNEPSVGLACPSCGSVIERT